MTTTASSPSLGTALVTGASSGIGALYADRLARRGYDLILVARNRNRLNLLADDISTRTGRAVEVAAADLGDAASLAKVEAKLREDASITLLVNNAGIGTHTPLLQSDVERMAAMIALNVVAPTRLTYAAAPGFVARGRGAVINIASVAAMALCRFVWKPRQALHRLKTHEVRGIARTNGEAGRCVSLPSRRYAMAMKLAAVRNPRAARLACCINPFMASTKAFDR
jgi:NAD(P)-dependent dehydrogenase (short-subunit alcohol dehydrogenase family)